MNARQELKVMLDAVDRLAVEMKRKLRAKARDGWKGGIQLGNRDTVAKSLHEHVDRLTGLCPHCQKCRKAVWACLNELSKALPSATLTTEAYFAFVLRGIVNRMNGHTVSAADLPAYRNFMGLLNRCTAKECGVTTDEGTKEKK